MNFLALAAGGAAGRLLEMHRTKYRDRSHTAGQPQSQEQDLRKVLEEAQQALEEEKLRREHAQVEARRLLSENATLEAKATVLQDAKDVLEDHSQDMLRRYEQLENQAAGLQDKNEELVQQVADLKLENDAELAETVKQVADLKREVAVAIHSWADGTLNTAGFLDSMKGLGVEVQCSSSALPTLPSARDLSTGDLQLSYNSAWTSKMQQVMDNQDRMHRLLARASAQQPGASALSPVPEPGQLTARTAAKDGGMTSCLEMAGFSVPGLTPRGSRDMSQVLTGAAGAAGNSGAMSSHFNSLRPLPPRQPQLKRMTSTATTSLNPDAAVPTATKDVMPKAEHFRAAESRSGPRIVLRPIENSAAAALQETNTLCPRNTVSHEKAVTPKRQPEQRVVMPRLQLKKDSGAISGSKDVMLI